MSGLQAPQAAIGETTAYHRKKILQAERILLDNPSDENLIELKRALEASKAWRLSLG